MHRFKDEGEVDRVCKFITHEGHEVVIDSSIRIEKSKGRGSR